jgi:hypothetical protein
MADFKKFFEYFVLGNKENTKIDFDFLNTATKYK